MDKSKLKSTSFIVSVLFSLKLILQVFNIDIPDQIINDFANGIASLITIWGIFYSHGAGSAAPIPQPTTQPQEVKPDVPNQV